MTAAMTVHAGHRYGPCCERLLSARDAEKLLGIAARRVRVWWFRRSQTNLWDYGTDRSGHPLFRSCDLAALARGERLPRPSART